MRLKRTRFTAKTALFVSVVVTLMVLSAIPIVADVQPVYGTPITANATSASSSLHVAGSGPSWPSVPLPTQVVCVEALSMPISLFSIVGPGCEHLVDLSQFGPVATAQDTATNIMTALGNYLNQTASTAAIFNATAQELLSYYANRAEAIVPYFLNQTWNATTYAQIAIDSGLVPAIEGMKLAIGQQEYQDWNATLASFINAFGPGAEYVGVSTNLNLANSQGQGTALLIPGDISTYETSNYVVSQPWMWLSGTAANGGSPMFYLNMATGGTIVEPLWDPIGGPRGNWTITDLTQGFSFFVPTMLTSPWDNQSGIPVVSTHYGINQFDLLRATCNANCSSANAELATSGVYAFENATTAVNPDIASADPNTMIPTILIGSTGDRNCPLCGPQAFTATVPNVNYYVCIEFGLSPGVGSCSTQGVQSGGYATQLGPSGPGQVVGGNNTLTRYAGTFQKLVFNTMQMAQAYYDVLRAVTDAGTYPIPPTCTIPPPSAAFPAAVNPQDYQLSLWNVIATYIGYLNSVGKVFNSTFSDTVGFCNDPNLAFSYNWSGSWQLALNISASVYIGSPNGSLSLNGSSDPGVLYSDVATWPVYNVLPTLLYPFEYQMNVPLNTTYPVPVNDPIAALLINYPGNLLYGANLTNWSGPHYGIPTYISLWGNGPYINISGNLTHIASGRSPSQGDAIMIDSCVYEGIPQNPCDIAVTYFNSFTIGIIHAFIYPTCASLHVCPSSGGGVGGWENTAGKLCGTDKLNQWYDAWAGYIVTDVAAVFVYIGNAASGIAVIGSGLNSFFTDLGCLLGWVVLIIVIFLIIWLAWKLIEFIRG